MQPEMKKILRYAYPYADEYEWDRSVDLNWTITKEILEKNKVKLTFLENMIKCTDISQDEIAVFQREIEDERGRDINRRTIELSDLLLRNGIRHLFPKFTFFYREHGDVDVLVPTSKFDKTVKLLQSHGYTLADEEPQKARLMGRARQIAETVHVHSKIHWGLEFVSTSDIWKSSHLFSIDNSHRVLVPSEEHCILITAAHAIFEPHMICLADVFQIEGITLRFPEINWQLLIKMADEEGWLSALYTFFVGVNAISSTFYDHEVVPRTVFIHMRALHKLLDKIVGMNVIAGSFSRAYEVPLYYPMSRIGMFFILAAAKKNIVPNPTYPFNAIVNGARNFI